MKRKYVEDSTRGSSVLEPKKYKADAYVQVWVQSRHLATLCRWLEANNAAPRYLSEVVRYSIEALVDFLVGNNEVEMIEDVDMAREMLERRFRVNLNAHKKGYKNLLHNRVLKDRKIKARAVVTGEVSVEGNSRDNIEELVKRYKELEEEKKKERADKYFNEAMERLEKVSEDSPDVRRVITEDVAAMAKKVYGTSGVNGRVSDEARSMSEDEVAEMMKRIEERDKKTSDVLNSCILPDGIDSVDE